MLYLNWQGEFFFTRVYNYINEKGNKGGILVLKFISTIKKAIAASVQRGWNDNAGVYITGAVLKTENVNNNYDHNHSTYTTTKGVVKKIHKANGDVRSARAAQFARASMTIKILSTTGSVLTTAQAVTKIHNGSATAWDYGDFTVGSVDTVAGSAEIIGGASYVVPELGETVAAYSWFRFWYDLGAQYGPSKWVGNDDTRWFN